MSEVERWGTDEQGMPPVHFYFIFLIKASKDILLSYILQPHTFWLSLSKWYNQLTIVGDLHFPILIEI